jgi:hypothetical protein
VIETMIGMILVYATGIGLLMFVSKLIELGQKGRK